MTPQEAIRRIKDHNEIHSRKEKFFAVHITEALKMAIKALEKQIPKKPIEDGYYDEPCVCPNCGSNVINEADNDYQFNYCYHCGQALDWSDSECEQ